jgi:CSLREA domain-containing protein
MKRGAVLLFTAALVALVMAVGIAERPTHAAEPFTVNATGDEADANLTDDVCDVDAGTGGDQCTLRAAIEEANDTADADTIEFNIPDTDTGCNAGVCTISPSSALPLIINPVTIDGYSQLGSRANTLSVGDDAVLKIELSGPDALNGLKIEANNSTVQGLVVNNWENGIFLGEDATGNTVRGNYIGTDATGTVTDPDGIPNNSDDLGNNIGVALTNALNNTIGGTTAGARNIISGNEAGISISGGSGNKMQGNYIGIGADASGITDLGNFQGVILSNALNNTIGGTTAGARNIISGNDTWGIRISDAESTGNKIQGNYIGITAAGDATLGNGDDGVRIQADADNNTIGGATAGARNIISGNGSDGVEVRFDSGFDPNAATGNRILSNSIYDNDALGIDLVHSNDPAGVSLNDEGDGDGGNPDANPPDPASAPNRLQNFPVITSAKLTTRRIGGHRRKVTLIKGTLDSTPSTARTDTFTLQFFSSPEADNLPNPPYTITGHGEGKTFLGQKSVRTNSSGDATFTFQTRKKVPNGQVVTATATDKSTGDTSEFSKACTVPGVPCP